MSRLVRIAKALRPLVMQQQHLLAARPTMIRAALPVTNMLVKSFGSDAHGGKDEPFLDPKVVTDRIVEVVKNFEKVNKTKVVPAARFKEDLDLDSLDAVEVVMAIEEEFSIEIPDSEADKILSIADAVAYVSGHPMAK